MKVLLIIPYFQRITTGHIVVPRGDIPSAALLHLASILRQYNHEPILLDFNNVETDDIVTIISIIAKKL